MILKIIKRRFIWLSGFVGVLVILTGCSSQQSPEEKQAVQIAKQEALNRGWTEIDVGAIEKVNGNWEVTLWRLPKTPGGFGTFVVSTNGKVIRFVPGL